jgi:menaquinone C8-methyltransferase
LIPEFLGYITRQQGKKFLKLRSEAGKAAQDDAAAGTSLPLYVHIPFCKKLCPFCCFNRYLFQEDNARAYFRSLKKELDIYVQAGYQFSSFYFGGGTPTVLMDELISFILYLKEKCTVKDISLETTPPELTPENIGLLKEAGVSRLSIGVQSFDNEALKAMGRTLCTGEEAREKLLLVQNKFATVNVDLIFNFPFQTLEKFEADVRVFKDLGIDQATFYPLMPSPHKKDALERKFSRVDNSREKDYYKIILKDIFDQGYRASTVWCFCRTEHMIDEYIVNSADYVGIGAGSVSLVKGNFYVNAFSLEHYEGLLKNNLLPIVRQRNLSEREYLYYYFLTKLFGMTIDPAQFKRDFQADIHQKLGMEIRMLRLFGMVKEEEQLRLTRQGMYPVSVMMREFFTSLNNLREYCILNKI